ncbi:MAG: putative S-layer protein [Candidatus Pacearchaeota archaeon]|nr:putative S-layer protein [Candidatus Pacearchaeota archaeon]
MENKKLNLLFASVFALIFLMGFASATITLTPSIATLSQTSGSFNLTVSSNQNETIDLTILSLSDNSGHTITFALSPAQVIIDTLSSTSHVVNVTYVVESGFNFEFTKTYNANLTAIGTVSGQMYRLLPFTASSFCEASNVGELKTTIEDVQVTEGFGDENDWFAFDTVEIEVKVKNNGDEDLNDVSVEWGLYDTQSKTWTIDVDEEDSFDLDSGDSEVLTITFTLDDSMDEDLQDLEKGDYIFYIRATGEIADGDHEGENTCSSDSETGNLKLEKDLVVLKNLEVPEVVQCDSEVQILGDAWNIGSDDQNNVYALVYNKELGLNDEKVELDDIDSFESSDFVFSFTVPEDVQEKKYPITITIYDENDDVYENINGCQGNNNKHRK